MDVDDEMSLIAFTSGKSPALEELKQTILGDYEYQYDDPASIAFLQTWTPENLLKVYHGTYTADVVKQVAEWVRARGGILGPIQYFEIPPCYCYIYHHDKPSFFNLHIPIQTQVGNFFIAENELGTMLDAGHLYALNTTGYHTALNSSKQTRIHLVFTVLNNSL
jgi:hypothetical protein